MVSRILMALCYAGREKLQWLGASITIWMILHIMYLTSNNLLRSFEFQVLQNWGKILKCGIIIFITEAMSMKCWPEVWTLIIPQQIAAISIPIFHWGRGWGEWRDGNACGPGERGVPVMIRGGTKESIFLQLCLLERNLGTIIAVSCSNYLWLKTLAYKKERNKWNYLWSVKS